MVLHRPIEPAPEIGNVEAGTHRRGQKPSGAACAGMPEVGNGATRHRAVD